jgi:hypothetical protein
MPIPFENNNDVVVYALKKVISNASSHQLIFLAQSVWWISSVIALQQGLVTYINNLHTTEVLVDSVHSEKEDTVIVAQEVLTTP